MSLKIRLFSTAFMLTRPFAAMILAKRRCNRCSATSPRHRTNSVYACILATRGSRGKRWNATASSTYSRFAILDFSRRSGNMSNNVPDGCASIERIAAAFSNLPVNGGDAP